MKEFIKKHAALFAILYPLIRIRRGLRRGLTRRRSARFKRFYDQAFRAVEAGSLVVSLPAFKGSFEFDFRSHILRLFLETGRFETNEAKWAEQHLNPVLDAIDVGANVGLYTVLFARGLEPSRRVLAIEPVPTALALLKRNLQRNHCADRVVLYEGAAADAPGIIHFQVVPGREEYSTAGALSHPAIQDCAGSPVEAAAETIDRLVTRFGLTPGFLKIDVEGSEHRVLKGAQETLRRFKPIILAELSDPLLVSCGASSGDVLRLLQTHGYRVFDASDPDHPISVPFDGEIMALPQGTD